MNIRIDIEYDGSEYFGWQRQPELPTVQGAIEDAISEITGTHTSVHGAGRTDTGVHAFGQVANFQVSSPIPAHKWWKVLNQHLPRSIRILQSSERSAEFHSSRSAVSKIYEYRVRNHPTPSALDQRCYFYPRPLDWEAIRQALPKFIGRRDFQSFQASGGTVKTTVRELYEFRLIEEGEGRYRFQLVGSGFLKQMVRNIIGTVLEVGEGRRTPESMEQVIDSCRRGAAGRTAPGCGLFLMRVNYPEGI